MLGVLVAPALAEGFPDWSGPYSSQGDSPNCVSSDWVDPVTLLFEGGEAHAANVARAFEVHLGWFNQSGGGQRLRVKVNATQYSCKFMDAQRANGGSTSARTHARLWHVPASGGANHQVAATPHHEDFVLTCIPPRHAVDKNGPNGSGFDRGRQAVANAFEANRHSRQHQSWGNTRNFRQCDGDLAGSNGNGVKIGMGHRH
ncbi:MAG: hypothetical protein ACRDMA_04215 [Solirubrobacterales bacterium]